jgi:ADP-ribose pyrophosphatase
VPAIPAERDHSRLATVPGAREPRPAGASSQLLTAPGQWQVETSRVLVDNPWVKITECDYRLPGDRSVTGFICLNEKPGVNVLAIDKHGNVLLVRQYRPAVGQVVWDFPAGYLEPADPAPAERARAELREETGYTCAEILSTGRVNVAPHRSDKADHTFLALGCEKAGPARLDAAEDVMFSVLPLSTLGQLIRTGEFNCSICLASLSLARIARPGLFGEL